MSLSILLILCIAKESVTRYIYDILDVWSHYDLKWFIYIYKTLFGTALNTLSLTQGKE